MPAYIPRTAESTLHRLLAQYKVVLVTGARQVGKTTMVRHALSNRMDYVTLDDPAERRRAVDDPALFFKTHGLPLIIDEVQQAPELFSYVKYLVDQQEDMGQVVLTGSQTFALMRGATESLAGRVTVLELSALSLRERLASDATGPFVPCDACLSATAPAAFDLWETLFRGLYPRLQDDAIDPERYWGTYVQTYLERDVRSLVAVQDELRFYDFLVACAARTGQLLNLADMAADVGISPTTAKGWLSVLQASGVVSLLRPFHTNVSKRLSKTPKLHFRDTGLACHLLGWHDAVTLSRGPAAGQLLESFVVSEVLKSYEHSGAFTRPVMFYRDARKREVDVVIRREQTLYPIEVKRAALPSGRDTRNFSALDGLGGFERGLGAVICQVDQPAYLSRDTVALPVWAI